MSTVLNNSLKDLVTDVRAYHLATGGSTLSGYGTIGHSMNASLITLNRILLTYTYVNNGIFQTAIDLPIQDALSKKIEIESGELDQFDLELQDEFFEEHELWSKLEDALKWKRIYGGSTLLINTNQDPQTPLDIKSLKNSPITFYDIDRWQLDTSQVYFDDFEGLFYNAGRFDEGMFHLWGKPIHQSRFIKFKNKRAPAYVRRMLRGWGMSDAERMIRDLNLYLKTQDVLYEILDESKLDVYHIKGLAAKLINANGTAEITNRVQAANELKNYLRALVLDSEETYEQKTLTFSGLAEVSRENKIGIASALRIPMTKLFGISSAGFNSGEDDLESYNQMVESEIRVPILPALRELYDISFMCTLGFIPKYKLKWPAMRVLTEEQEQAVKTAKQGRILELYDRGLLKDSEAMQILRKEGVVTIETAAEKGFTEVVKLNESVPSTLIKLSNEVNFDESKHPRRPDGKFGTGGSTKEEKHDKIKRGGLIESKDKSDLPEHIKQLKLPPAWTDIKYSESPDADLLATGKDAKGRTQYVYSKNFVSKQAQEKFKRINALNEQFEDIQNINDENVKKGNEEAICLSLIMKTGIRPGSEKDTGAEKQAYGATTLRSEHIIIDGDNVSLQFVGKKGVDLNIAVDDKELKDLLIKRKQEVKEGKPIFKTDNSKLLKYTQSLGDGGFKTKDLRTHLGTSTAINLIKNMGVPKNEKEYRKAVLDVAKQVSKKLGNTPVVALQSYINPAVFGVWKSAMGGAQNE